MTAVNLPDVKLGQMYLFSLAGLFGRLLITKMQASIQGQIFKNGLYRYCLSCGALAAMMCMARSISVAGGACSSCLRLSTSDLVGHL